MVLRSHTIASKYQSWDSNNSQTPKPLLFELAIVPIMKEINLNSFYTWWVKVAFTNINTVTLCYVQLNQHIH